jgi:hypothetical protein
MTNTTDRPSPKGKFVPAIGKDFEITAPDPEVLKAEAMLDTARTRNFLAKVVVLTILSGTALATGFSLYEANFQYLATTWAAAGATLTMVLTSYFKKGRSSG